MVQDLQEAEPEQVVVPVVEMKLLEPEPIIWKDHDEVVEVVKKDMTEKTRLLLFGGAMVGVSVLVYGLSKLVHYMSGR